MRMLLLFPLCSLIWCQIEVGSENTLDIMTWNLQEFPLNETETLDYIDDLITSSNLDVIALQEIESTNYFNNLVNSLPGWNGFRANSASYNINLAYLYTEDIQFNNIYEIYTDVSIPFPRRPLITEITYSNEQFFIINNHFKCCGDGIIQNDSWDEEYRRQQASIYLKNYIDTYLSDENVIVLGDFNDDIAESQQNNVFQMILDDSENYLFVDLEIANGNVLEWSYPSWPSHLDHIIITNELFDEFNNVNYVQTLQLEKLMDVDWNVYDQYISDHRPVGFHLVINP